MENYLLYGEIGAAAGKTVYKGRRRGTIQFHGLHKWNKTWKQLVTNEASDCQASEAEKYRLSR